VVCEKPGQLDTDHPATVVVIIYDAGMGPLRVRLAHPTCSRSGVVIVLHAPKATGHMKLPAMAWLRDGKPASVVVIAPRVRARRLAGGNDLLDVFASGLLASGFQLLTSPDMTLPVLSGRLYVQFGPGQHIQIADDAGNAYYDGTLPVPDGWAELAQVTGLIGIIVVAGIDLHDNDRDHIADLYAAIRDGAAVGAAVQVDPDRRPNPDRPAPPQYPELPAR
jgi:hypothetical protein